MKKGTEKWLLKKSDGAGGFLDVTVGDDSEEDPEPEAEKEEEEDGDETEEPAPVVANAADPAPVAAPAPDGREYRKEWYASGKGYWGIKQRFGKHSQVFSVGGRSSVLSKLKKEKIADEAIERMQNGLSEESGKKWAEEAVQAAEAK